MIHQRLAIIIVSRVQLIRHVCAREVPSDKNYNPSPQVQAEAEGRPLSAKEVENEAALGAVMQRLEANRVEYYTICLGDLIHAGTQQGETDRGFRGLS